MSAPVVPAQREVRAVLLKPGDTLLIGNLGDIEDVEGLAESARYLRDKMGLAHVVLFTGDITIGAS